MCGVVYFLIYILLKSTGCCVFHSKHVTGDVAACLLMEKLCVISTN